ncbi:glycosyltransferase family 39 protein [Calothrix sp. 336/3]|uniref:glycosyltransferase family 39 protein n=1 Tax=Calothrix sp. 336/3 TaxID=1337936 RepID=UPI000624A49B|nr:glycosyl transferase [Calothrix sp. 336/3]AKG20185.1 glycosyltransferase [Calothrix sp. 336/3]
MNTLRQFFPFKSSNILLLILWLVVGTGLRFANLTAKSPWTDEFSTLVFSLGNSFIPVPLDEAISIDTLLQPLQPHIGASIADVLHHLFQESNHPPLYFILTHLWLRLFPTEYGLVSLWGGRSLAVIFGGLSIIAIYGLSYLAFRSPRISHLSAALMAISPYGIFLAQEARHYTLAILWVIASCGCLMVTIRHIYNRSQLSWWLVFTWILVNALGIATHYFFALTLLTEVVVLIIFAWQQISPNNITLPWWRIFVVAMGTGVAGMVWIPVFLQNTYGDKLTDWIQGDRVGLALLSPIFQALAAWITMIILLPVESPNLVIVIISGLIMGIFLIWAIPIFWRGIQEQFRQPENRVMMEMLVQLIGSAIAIFFIFTYFLGIDLTRGARYNFIYYPAVLLILAASLAVAWQKNQPVQWGVPGKVAVCIILFMGFLSAVTVTSNLGYQKYYRPDLFVQLITEKSSVSRIIATTQITHVQIGEMMGVARELKITDGDIVANTQFFLQNLDKNLDTNNKLDNVIRQISQPLDVWLVNLQTSEPEAVQKCILDTQDLPNINGYVYKLYHCGSN